MDTEVDKIKSEEFKQQGNDEFKKKNYTKAVELYSKAISYNSQESSYFANRAACYLQLKKYQKCIEDCNHALSLDPKFAKALRRRGNCYMNQGKYEDAINDLKKATKLDPKDKQIEKDYNDYSQIPNKIKKYEQFMSESKFESALGVMDSIRVIAPDADELQLKHLDCLAKNGKTDEANKVLAQLVNSGNTAKPDQLYLRGIIDLYNGNTERAKKAFSDGMKMDPDNTKCRHALKQAKAFEEIKDKGNQCIKDNKYDEAIELYTQALQIDPFNRKLNAILYSNRALAYFKKNDLDSALKDCDKSIDLNPMYFKPYIKRAEIRVQQEDYDGALQDYHKAQEIDPNQDMKGKIKELKQKIHKSKQRDYYAILGVPKDASQEVIKKAYRKLALQWHPDKHKTEDPVKRKEADKKFKDINAAHSVLNDPDKRRQYDQGVDPEAADGGFGGTPFAPDFDPSQIFQTFFGGGGNPFGGGGGFSGFGGQGGNDNDFGGFGGFPGGFKIKFTQR